MLSALEPFADSVNRLLPIGFPHDLLIAVCGLALAVILGRTPSRYPAVRQLVMLAVVVAAIATLACVSRLFQGLAWPTAITFSVGLMIAAGLIGKLLLADRYAGLRDARHTNKPETTPLPFQRRALDLLLEQARLSPTPSALGLQAEWGMGKSFVIDHLLDELNSDGNFVAVRVNIWEYEDHADLQYGAMQALLAHPRVLERYGWLFYPLWMLVRDWGGLSLRRFHFGWKENNVDVDGKLHLPWQSRFERIVARQHAAGRRVVIVLDEIDRAGAFATQAALTMVMRSLSLPSVVAVVPHVQQSIDFKAFHPDMITLDDLRDTVSTYLEERLYQSNFRAGDIEKSQARFYSHGQSERFQMLAADFMESAQTNDWTDFYTKMSERYLRYSVVLGRPDGFDVLAILKLPEIAVLFRPFGDGYQRLLDWVGEETKAGNPNFVRIDMRVRWLKGDLLKYLSAPVSSNLDPRFCLMLALSRGRSL